MSNTTIPTERGALPTINELKDAITTYFPNLGSHLSDRYQNEDVVNGNLVYKTRGGQQELTITIVSDGTTIASIQSRMANTPKQVSEGNYVDALRTLRGTWDKAERMFMPIGS